MKIWWDPALRVWTIFATVIPDVKFLVFHTLGFMPLAKRFGKKGCYYIYIEEIEEMKIYLFFDSVHLKKNVCNNLLVSFIWIHEIQGSYPCVGWICRLGISPFCLWTWPAPGCQFQASTETFLLSVAPRGQQTECTISFRNFPRKHVRRNP